MKETRLKDPGLKDGRKLPDEVMEHLRRRAVHAVRERGHSSEVVADVGSWRGAAPA